MTLGEKLKLLRSRRGWTQDQAAQQLGVTAQVVSNYERDYRSPDTEGLKHIAKVFNCSLDWLLGNSDDPDVSDPITELFEQSPQAKRIIHSLARAKELDDEDYDIIAKQVDDFIAYAKAKKNKGSS